MNVICRPTRKARAYAAPRDIAVAEPTGASPGEALWPDSEDRLVRASFDIPAGELRSLDKLAARRNTSPAQVVRQALATESFLQRIVDRGGVIMESFGRRARELRFSQL